MDQEEKERLLAGLTDLDKKVLLMILKSFQQIREGTGWGNTLIVFKGGTVDEIQTVISRRGLNLKV
ncbi:MAG: hypothetical protein IMZ50_02600 [Candidatus Atribacteria bacterium]|nr:hypothetical protein [Candidatus Atribacteria bacterium]